MILNEKGMENRETRRISVSMSFSFCCYQEGLRLIKLAGFVRGMNKVGIMTQSTTS